MEKEKADVPMIPKHQAESILAHMSWAIRCMMIVAMTFAIAMVLAIIVFVTGYTSRTKDWLNTYALLQNQNAAVEVADEIQQQSPP